MPASRHGRFTPSENALDASWIGGWMSYRVGLDTLNSRNISCINRGIEPACSPITAPCSLCCCVKHFFYICLGNTFKKVVKIKRTSLRTAEKISSLLRLRIQHADLRKWKPNSVQQPVVYYAVEQNYLLFRNSYMFRSLTTISGHQHNTLNKLKSSKYMFTVWFYSVRSTSVVFFAMWNCKIWPYSRWQFKIMVGLGKKF
jgi:hypothetical protein